MSKIAVLLGTYNGSMFIEQQLSSLFVQALNIEKNDNQMEIYISDDGSSDNTVEIIKGCMLSCNKPKVEIINYERKGGVQKNFEFLIKNVSADYYFFCDQDDFWLPNKINLYLKEFAQCEEGKPFLIHSDLIVADGNLFPINKSMFEFQSLRKEASFSNLLVQNSITGCVMAMNRAAIDLLKNSQVCNSIMHDWYAALIVSAFGNIKFIDKSTILYRQHGRNQVGAKKMGLSVFFNKLMTLSRSFSEAKASVVRARNQAILFKADFEDSLPADKLKQISDYIASFDRGLLIRLYLFLFKGVNKAGFYRNMGFLFLYLFFKDDMKNKM